MSVVGFEIDGTAIPAPTLYKPKFATTSTEDSDRTQDLVMHNTPMGTIAGYDMQWDSLSNAEIALLLSSVMNKSSFMFRHRDPTNSTGWTTSAFYCSNFSMNAQRIRANESEELWDGLSMNFRAINPKKDNM